MQMSRGLSTYGISVRPFRAIRHALGAAQNNIHVDASAVFAPTQKIMKLSGLGPPVVRIANTSRGPALGLFFRIEPWKDEFTRVPSHALAIFDRPIGTQAWGFALPSLAPQARPWFISTLEYANPGKMALCASLFARVSLFAKSGAGSKTMELDPNHPFDGIDIQQDNDRPKVMRLKNPEDLAWVRNARANGVDYIVVRSAVMTVASSFYWPLHPNDRGPCGWHETSGCHFVHGDYRAFLDEGGLFD